LFFTAVSKGRFVIPTPIPIRKDEIKREKNNSAAIEWQFTLRA
jgi:hypothetical protein